MPKDTIKLPAGTRLISQQRANERELLLVTVRKYKGFQLVDIRRWYYDVDANLRPSDSGISFGPRDIKPLRKALRKADRRLGRP